MLMQGMKGPTIVSRKGAPGRSEQMPVKTLRPEESHDWPVASRLVTFCQRVLGVREEHLATARWGIFTTAVGYAAGYTPNPTYEGVLGWTGTPKPSRWCSTRRRFRSPTSCGGSGARDPASGMGQGNDRGTRTSAGRNTATFSLS